jgi:NADH dehydrogenase (ubiquinone) Fe-S protein 6
MLGRRAFARLPRRLPAAARRTNASVATSPQNPAAGGAEKAGVPQAPNAEGVWSDTQRARPHQHSGPRFEQVIMDMQPNPQSAMAMIAEEPIRLVHGRKAVCDGGAFPRPASVSDAHVPAQAEARSDTRRSLSTWFAPCSFLPKCWLTPFRTSLALGPAGQFLPIQCRFLAHEPLLFLVQLLVRSYVRAEAIHADIPPVEFGSSRSRTMATTTRACSASQYTLFHSLV